MQMEVFLRCSVQKRDKLGAFPQVIDRLAKCDHTRNQPYYLSHCFFRPPLISGMTGILSWLGEGLVVQ
jgi:hypothetical protein